MNTQTEKSSAQKIADELKPELSKSDYTASPAFDAFGNGGEYVLITPVEAAYKAAGKTPRERKEAFNDRCIDAACVVTRHGYRCTRDGNWLSIR